MLRNLESKTRLNSKNLIIFCHVESRTIQAGTITRGNMFVNKFLTKSLGKNYLLCNYCNFSSRNFWESIVNFATDIIVVVKEPFEKLNIPNEFPTSFSFHRKPIGNLLRFFCKYHLSLYSFTSYNKEKKS